MTLQILTRTDKTCPERLNIQQRDPETPRQDVTHGVPRDFGSNRPVYLLMRDLIPLIRWFLFDARSFGHARASAKTPSIWGRKLDSFCFSGSDIVSLTFYTSSSGQCVKNCAAFGLRASPELENLPPMEVWRCRSFLLRAFRWLLFCIFK